MLDFDLCGIDRESASFEYGTPSPGSPYLVIGHEELWAVSEVGTAVDRFRPGDLFVTMVRRPSGLPEYPACAAGRPELCVTGKFTDAASAAGAA